MKENERSMMNEREKLPKEFYISGAVSVTVTIGALVGLLVHLAKDAEKDLVDANFGFSPRVERMMGDSPDKLLSQMIKEDSTVLSATVEPTANIPLQQLSQLREVDNNLSESMIQPSIQTQEDTTDKDLRNLIPLLKEKERLELVQAREKAKVLEIIDLHPEAFLKQDRVDIEMYYPIYKAAGDKFNVDWFLLWIVHQKESTVSRDSNAFNGSNGYAGAMQRNPYFYPESVVDLASKGLEQLAVLPQRNPTDWREIAFAAWKINRDRQNAQNRGANEPLLSALFAYSAQGPALSRWDKFNYFSNIFNES